MFLVAMVVTGLPPGNAGYNPPGNVSLYIPPVQPAKESMYMATQYWWYYPRVDNVGYYPDPQGPFRKPDTNVQIPGNYPVAAILPGVVTSVQSTSWGGQEVVTIKLDSPLNNLATHTFYEHMGSATVSQGQHVNQGDTIGYNNPDGMVPLGFGLYSGDVYGSGPAWDVLQQDIGPGGARLLDPVPLIESVAAGRAIANVVNTGGGILTNVPVLGAVAGASTTVIVVGILAVFLVIGVVIFISVKAVPKG
jgi:murein DD-endopeptidase MepM/ murein hydrolase activator NlpD